MMPLRPRGADDATMSDRTILVTVEDLIYTAFGPTSENQVYFKLLHTIFHILARQLRLLEQDVEIKIDDVSTTKPPREQVTGRYDDESETYSSSSAEGEDDERGPGRERIRAVDRKKGKKDKGDKEERRVKKEQGEKSKRGQGEKDDGKGRSKDRESKDKSSRDRDDKDKSSRGRDGSSRRRRGEEDAGGRERARGGDRGGEVGADGRSGRGPDREDRDAQGQDGFGGHLGRQTSGTSITVTETTRRGPGGSTDKILVAERTPAARVRPARVGSIEVVTASQFALLGKAVKQLEQITGPLPQPVLPDNETLRQDLAQGRASLQDTMQAVQLKERVKAAEQGLYQMAELLTQLAQSGLLPSELADQVGAIEEYLQTAVAAAANLDVFGQGAGPGKPGEGRGERGADGEEKLSSASQMDAEKSTASATAAAEAAAKGRSGVTHNEMSDILTQMTEEFIKEINKATARGNRSADTADNVARNVAAKLEIAMKLDERVTTLLEMTQYYANQLEGFDSGIMTQVQNFQQQLVETRNELAGGLAMLDASYDNAATAVLLEMTERHQGMVVELEDIVHLHQNLHITQRQISDELTSLIGAIKLLQEQKADRDEILGGLSDKVDRSSLTGLLHDEDFAEACTDIEKHIAKCYEVFNGQNEKWRDSLAELMVMATNKADIILLMSEKDTTSASLYAIQKLLSKLEVMLGDPEVNGTISLHGLFELFRMSPHTMVLLSAVNEILYTTFGVHHQAAILMRKLAKDSSCGACMTRALMEPEDATHGKPLPLPALRPPALGVERKPCFQEVKLMPPDIRDHTCRRWVGGSHTLIGNAVKEKAAEVQIIPTKKYEGYGIDGKLYLMEDDIQPCAECNKLGTDEPDRASPRRPTPNGAGDQASAPRRRR